MAKNKKPDEAKKQDQLSRNAEMAETQSPEVAAKIYKKGDKYYCAECNSELPMHRDCPSCHAHIDWERVRMGGR
jgi:rubrerythrin